jgi:hypothetical protein
MPALCAAIVEEVLEGSTPASRWRLRDVGQERGRVARPSLADYDGKTLGGIDALVQPFLTRDSAQAGKIRVLANLLNPGSHYAPVPQANDLVVVALRLRSQLAESGSRIGHELPMMGSAGVSKRGTSDRPAG